MEDRLGSVSRGAVQTTIERFTFPHKYKKVTNLKMGSVLVVQPKIGMIVLFPNLCENSSGLCRKINKDLIKGINIIDPVRSFLFSETYNLSV